MQTKIHILCLFVILFLLNGCGNNSKSPKVEWVTSDDYVEAEDSALSSSMSTPVDVSVFQGTTLAEAGRKVYTDLIALENYGLGGIKLCSEMSGDRQGLNKSSYQGNQELTLLPPESLHLHKITYNPNSSNIVCEIMSDKIHVDAGNIQSNRSSLYGRGTPFSIPITVYNKTYDTIPVVIPLGQMLEVQAPHVQNVVISNSASAKIAPLESYTFKADGYCAAKRRGSPSGKPAKLTPFVLTAPQSAYQSQNSLWNFLATSPNADKVYDITFYAWGIGPIDDERNSLTGHAFVDIPGIGVVGFGPTGGGILNPQGGIVSPHSNSVQYADYKISVPVDRKALENAQRKCREWQDNPPQYVLGRRDCTSFVMDIADAAGIYYGPRWAIQFPVGFMESLSSATQYLNVVATQFLNELQTYNE